MILKSEQLAPAEMLRILGMRFRDYRLRLNLTRKQISEFTDVGMTTLFKFETGRSTDMSFMTLMKLLRAVGMAGNWEALLPELPESPYLYKENVKRQRARKKTSEK